MRTPTPPLAPLGLERWIPETPHNTAQLELQSQAIKDYLKRRTKSPPSPTEAALDQLVKGCELSMNLTVLLTEEVRQLRAVNAKQVKKRARPRRFLATGGTLTVQEALALSEPAVQLAEPVIEAIGRVVADEPVVRQRVPRMCSLCRALSHTARTCPERPSS